MKNNQNHNLKKKMTIVIGPGDHGKTQGEKRKAGQRELSLPFSFSCLQTHSTLFICMSNVMSQCSLFYEHDF